jgi:hypothetical protein
MAGPPPEGVVNFSGMTGKNELEAILKISNGRSTTCWNMLSFLFY